jgi:DNA-binding CsgD family transcriptional regulator
MMALLERDLELQAMARAAAAARAGTGALVVVDGPAGVGKTALMAAARAAAEQEQLLTLSARGAELERAFAYGVVRQLFDGVAHDPAADASSLFAGAARFAAPLLQVQVEGAPTVPSEDAFAARHAVYWLTANVAADRPLALLVDDAHWADEASLAALAHVAHRLEGLPVALVVAARTEESDPVLDALRRDAADRGILLHVRPLGEDAATEVVRSVAPEADDRVCHACYRASGGNPFLLGELARSLVAAGDGTLDVERVVTQSTDRVTREVGARLSRLSDAAGRLARAVAVLGDDVPLRSAAALAEIEQDEAAVTADSLVAAGLFRGTKPLAFLHPLLRAAVYDDLSHAERARAHGRAARLLAADAESPERIGAQLLRCQPAADAWASGQLVAAARLAGGRGSAEAAAKYLRRALDEPPPAEDRQQVLIELGVAEAMASEADASIAHLREALSADLPVELRLLATQILAALLGHHFRVAEATEAVEGQLDALSSDPELQATAQSMLVNVARLDPVTRPRSLGVVEQLRERVDGGGQTDPAVLGTVATEMVMAAQPAEPAVELAQQALAGYDWSRSGPDWSGYIAVRVLVMAERYEPALAALDQGLELARERGSAITFGGGLAFRGEAHLRVGDLASAEVDVRTLLEIATASGWEGGEGFAVTGLGEVLVERGELDEAEQLLESERTVRVLTRGYTTVDMLNVRGRLLAARGRLAEAEQALRESGERSTATDVVNPAVAPWRSDLAHVLLERGDAAEARRLAEEELELARRFGTPRAIAGALRAAARVEGGEREIAMLGDACELLRDSPARLEAARTHAALGSALRAAGELDAAREPLRAAVDLAHRCGARALENQALEELRATGARPRRRLATGAAALTPSERRIAELAAGGQQNREIAQALFVTTHTVEFHLRNAYRKLGITKRTELREKLASA